MSSMREALDSTQRSDKYKRTQRKQAMASLFTGLVESSLLYPPRLRLGIFPAFLPCSQLCPLFVTCRSSVDLAASRRHHLRPVRVLVCVCGSTSILFSLVSVGRPRSGGVRPSGS